MGRPAWVTEEIDLSRPSVARVYDYHLGGFHNFGSDRALAEQVIAEWPRTPLLVRANRGFLRRAVTHLVRDGVTQFLDIGAGIPTAGSTHEIARAVDPQAQARVVYSDIDPVAMAHSRAILAGNPFAAAVPGDFNQPEKLLDDVREQGLLDLDRPVAVLMVALLHFVPDAADPAAGIATITSALAPGSALAISHATDELTPVDVEDFTRRHLSRTGSDLAMRSRSEVRALFDGYDLLEPGVVLLEQWQAGSVREVDNPERFPGWAGVGRRR